MIALSPLTVMNPAFAKKLRGRGGTHNYTVIVEALRTSLVRAYGHVRREVAA
jgi:hypothetical protein